MINAKFHWLLSEPKGENKRQLWSVGKMAEALYVNRAHLTDVLNNKPKHGAQTRPKAVKFFKLHFKEKWREILQALGWDENGSLRTATIAEPASGGAAAPPYQTPNVPRPTFHGEQVLAHGYQEKRI